MKFVAYNYIPILSTRPSEHLAYRMLSDPDKDNILPLLQVQKWGVSKSLDKTEIRILEMVGGRPYIGDLRLPKEIKTAADEAVVALSDPKDGFSAWADYVSAREQLVPVLQLSGDAVQIDKQAARFAAERGRFVIRMRPSPIGWELSKLDGMANRDFGGVDVLIMMDHGHLARSRELNLLAGSAVQGVVGAAERLRGANISVSFPASSFPGDFKAIHPKTDNIEIRERQFHRICASNLSTGLAGFQTLYSDYASVCLLSRGGGGQGPAPRIDYPDAVSWLFHRREIEPTNSTLNTKERCYQAAAQAVLQSPQWDDDAITWGANRIREAAIGNSAAYASPQKWTSVRINLHMLKQIYGPGEASPPPEDIWQD